MTAQDFDNFVAAPGEGLISLRAPAKINLSLVVLAPRMDGYHDLHSVMGTVNLFDDLLIRQTQTGGIRLHCSGIPCPEGPENLVIKAATRLAEQVGREPNLEIALHKRIPAGGGLGGASSDAAATLVGLNQLWQAGLEGRELHALAAGLGSDVPFFLYGPMAVCTGRGEVIRPLPYRCGSELLLIFPPVAVSTAAVYRGFKYDDNLHQQQLGRVRGALERGDLEGILNLNINNLAPVTSGLFPEIGAIYERLAQAGIGPVHQSGSGSTLFVTGKAQKLRGWQEIIEREVLNQEKNLGETPKPHVGQGPSLQTCIVRFLTSNRMANSSPEVLHADLGNQS